MSRELQGGVVLILAVVLARLALEGTYLAYVKASMLVPLLLTALLLVIIGLASLRRSPPAEEEDQHHHHGPPRSGLLLLAPVIVLVVVAPQPLGSYAVERGSTNAFAAEIAQDLPPLEVDGDPIELTVSETVLRTYASGAASIEGTPVRLTGFTVHGPEGELGLSRFAIACCAADASPRTVYLAGATTSVDPDEWLTITAVWEGARGGPDGEIPILRVIDDEVVDAPREPYEAAAF